MKETNAPTGYLLYSNEDKGAWYQEFMFEFDGDHDNEITYEYTLLEHGVAGTKNDTNIQCSSQVKKGRLKVYKFLEKCRTEIHLRTTISRKHPVLA